MSYQVHQKDIRALISCGAAKRLDDAFALIESGDRKYGDFRKVSYSAGVYGINGLCIEDTKTGDLFADAARTSNVFRFA